MDARSYYLVVCLSSSGSREDSGAVVRVDAAKLREDILEGKVAPTTLVSADEGDSWWQAWTLVDVPRPPIGQRLASVGSQAFPLGAFSPSAVVAGYAAVLLLVFGLPISCLLSMYVSSVWQREDISAKALEILQSTALPVLLVLIVGVAPVATLAMLGWREVHRNPARKGKGRVLFAIVVAAATAAPAVSALVHSLVRYCRVTMR
jgi:hypothetical protein